MTIITITKNEKRKAISQTIQSLAGSGLKLLELRKDNSLQMLCDHETNKDIVKQAIAKWIDICDVLMVEVATRYLLNRDSDESVEEFVMRVIRTQKNLEEVLGKRVSIRMLDRNQTAELYPKEEECLEE